MVQLLTNLTFAVKCRVLVFVLIISIISLDIEYFHTTPIQQRLWAERVTPPTLWKTNLKQSTFQNLSLKYYYYTDKDNGHELFTYFEQCDPIPSWTKNSPEHYLMHQLKANVHNNRVYDCLEADIFVIPVSLGAAKRQNCDATKHNSSIINQLNHIIFDNKNSCWNLNPRSHESHFLMAGGFQGQKLLQSQWIDSKWILATSSANEINNMFRTRQTCTISSGFTSIISKPNILKQNKQFYHSIGLHIQHINGLPHVDAHRDIKEWKHRKYNLFFMGQADDRVKYESRRIGLKALNQSNNVLIQTANSSDKFLYKACDFSSLACPCSTTHDTLMYIQLLSESKFNLMFRGDNPCSSRFYDAIALDVINIVISDSFYRFCLIGYDVMEDTQWQQMVVWIKEEQFNANPYHSIMDVVHKHNDTYFEQMLRFIHQWKPYLLWDAINSQTGEFALKNAAARCVDVY